MKHHAVVKAGIGEFGNALDVTRSNVRTELDDDVAAGGKGQGQAIGHLNKAPFVFVAKERI